MEKLPEAVILRIFSELGFDDLRAVAGVNKQCNRIAFDPFLWKFLGLRGHFLGHEGFIHFFERIRESVVCCDLKICTGLSRDLIIRIVKECPRLKILSLKGCQVDNKDIEEDVIYAPLGMKILDLRLLNDDASLIFRSLLPRMYTLEVLAMDHLHLPTFPVRRLLQSLRNLRVLYCYDCLSLIDDDLRDIATSCPFLETLSFAGCTCVSGKFLPVLILSCPRLRTLLLSGTRISNEFLMEINWAGSGITELDISYCYSITEEGLLSLLPRLPRLTYLQVSFCGWGRSLSNNVIQKMAERKCTRLETLDIHSSYNLSEHALYGLLRTCTNLTTLCVGSVFNSEGQLEATLRCLSNLKILFITKQSAIRTAVLLNFIVKYCSEIEAIALHNFYAISRSKVRVSLLNVMKKCKNFKTLCIRGTNIPLRTEMIAIAGVAKKISGRQDIDIVRSSHNFSVKPRYGLDNIMQAEFKRYRNRTLYKTVLEDQNIGFGEG